MVDNPGVASFRVASNYFNTDPFLKLLASKRDFTWNGEQYRWSGSTNCSVVYGSYSYQLLVGSNATNYEILVIRSHQL